MENRGEHVLYDVLTHYGWNTAVPGPGKDVTAAILGHTIDRQNGVLRKGRI